MREQRFATKLSAPPQAAVQLALAKPRQRVLRQALLFHPESSSRPNPPRLFRGAGSAGVARP